MMENFFYNNDFYSDLESFIHEILTDKMVDFLNYAINFKK